MVADRNSGPLMSIGEVSDATGVPQHVLRYWEGRLPQLQPVKRAGGRRYYRPEDVTFIRDVQRLVEQEGFTLDGASRALRRGEAPVAVATSGDAGADVLQELRRIRDRLARTLDSV
jgi:DNA-binding transcriptional MerR regulator